MEIMELKHPYQGYAMHEDGLIYLSVVMVVSEERGKGHFRKLIEDTKRTYDTVKVPQPNSFLKEVLLRYGFTETIEHFKEANEDVTVMVWEKSK